MGLGGVGGVGLPIQGHIEQRYQGPFETSVRWVWGRG